MKIVVWFYNLHYMARFRIAQACYVLSKTLAEYAVKVCPENAAWITHQDTPRK